MTELSWNRHSSHPHCAGEVDEGEEVNRATVVARGEVSEVLELVETTLDTVSQPVDVAVVVIWLLTPGTG
jgi:hypothetical protein